MGFHWDGMRAVSKLYLDKSLPLGIAQASLALRSLNRDFSIFYRGCKPPKSIHICIYGCKVKEKKGENGVYSTFIWIFIRFEAWI